VQFVGISDLLHKDRPTTSAEDEQPCLPGEHYKRDESTIEASTRIVDPC
jgi:hypothetical protein